MEHEEKPDKPKAEKRRLVDVITDLGNESSLHGLPRIISSRLLILRLAWAIILMGALTLCCIQVVGLFKEYYSYPVQTIVSLRHEQLPFPAVTFCNMNPIRSSANISSRSNISDKADYIYAYNDGTFGDNGAAFIDYFDVDSFSELFRVWQKSLQLEVRLIPLGERINAGHQPQDFIHKATLYGKSISPQNFILFPSTIYGNCFTLDNVTQIARGTGPRHSLSFVFNVERSDYMFPFTSAYGVRMVIHESGTFPLPENEGITLGTAFDTNIGVRLKKVTRLGGKYGECTDGLAFEHEFESKYTVPLCYAECESRSIKELCGCVPISTFDIATNTSICNTDIHAVSQCLAEVVSDIRKGVIECSCLRRCKEDVITATMSGRSWPHEYYLRNVLLKEACRKPVTNPSLKDACEIITSGNDSAEADYYIRQVAEDFLAVSIYYEDLNYEELTEEPLYPLLRFVSDIGGALGLYAGASILTYAELVQLVVEVVHHLAWGKRKVSAAET